MNLTNDQQEWRTRQVEAAQALQRRRIMPLPVPYGSKNPNRPNWQQERHNGDNAAFRAERVNIGMRLGHITDAKGHVLTEKFVDVDLDCLEAVRAAPFYLPPTEMIWGRASNPRSHYGYRLKSLEGAHTVQTLTDPLKPKGTGKGHAASILEIRFSGQTIAPGSLNAETNPPEEVRWDVEGDPAELEFAYLVGQAGKAYAAALLGRYWAQGDRHLASLPLAGFLCRGELRLGDAETFVRAVCAAANDDEVENRLGAVRDTYAKADAGQPYTAAKTLEEHIDPKVVALIRKSLGLKKAASGGDIGPDGYALSDVGNAERFVERFGGIVRYCDDEAQWYTFAEPKWEPDRSNRIMRLAVDALYGFRARIADRSQPNLGNTQPDQWERHARDWGKTRNLKAMLEIAKALVPVLPEEFDCDENLLNLLDGTVVLNRDTGQHYVRAHSPADLLTKVWNARYVPDAAHEDVEAYWQQFLPEPERRAFIEEAVGYSLSGGPKRFNFQLLGPSHAGKSMLLRILSEQGGDYAVSLTYKSLKTDDRGGDRPRSDLASLRGARVVTITEVPSGASFDTDLFNAMLSGGDRTAVRGAYERRTQRFVFTHTLWTSGNKPYGVKGDSAAAYTRIHVVTFGHPMPEQEQDDRCENATVDSERTGDAFLACWLRGFARLYGEKGGRLTPPDSVRAATDAVRRDLDPVEELIDEMLVITGDRADYLVKSEVNCLVKDQAIESRLWKSWGYKEQGAFDEALEKRPGVSRGQSSALERNKPLWMGVRWRGTEDEQTGDER